MSEVDISDHTLVWATHAGVEHAALVPRSFLHPRFSTGWSEVTENSQKVKAAVAEGSVPLAAPAPSQISPAGASPKEK